MKNMTPGIWSSFYEFYPTEMLFTELQSVGFEALDFSTHHIYQVTEGLETGEADRFYKRGLEIRKFREEYGLETPQGHVEFRYDILKPEIRTLMLHQAEFLIGLGAKNIVFHATGDQDDDPQGFDRYGKLISAINSMIPVVRGTGARFAVENLRNNLYVGTSDGILKLISDLDAPEFFGVCYDSGHLYMNKYYGLTEETGAHFVENVGDKLCATHINGNLCLGTDDHLLPFNGKATQTPDWKSIMKALRESPYDGLFSFEVPGESQCPLAIRHEKLKYIYFLANYLLSDEFQEQNDRLFK